MLPHIWWYISIMIQNDIFQIIERKKESNGNPYHLLICNINMKYFHK